MIFFLAGFETTSITLSYCLYELAMNPDIQNKVKEEIRTHLKNHKEINIDFLQEITYMEQVIQGNCYFDRFFTKKKMNCGARMIFEQKELS